MPLPPVIKKLQERACQIRKLEAEAAAILTDNYNLRAYHDLLEQKARILHDISDLGRDLTWDLDIDLQKLLRDRLGGFSHAALKALHLDSVFYMAALLYPENYQPGTKNDLEIFIDTLGGLSKVTNNEREI